MNTQTNSPIVPIVTPVSLAALQQLLSSMQIAHSMELQLKTMMADNEVNKKLNRYHFTRHIAAMLALYPVASRDISSCLLAIRYGKHSIEYKDKKSMDYIFGTTIYDVVNVKELEASIILETPVEREEMQQICHMLSSIKELHISIDIAFQNLNTFITVSQKV